MPSLDFDLEKSRFHAFYGQNLPLLKNALESFIALLTDLVAPSAAMDVTKIEGRIKDADECVRKFSRKYRAALEDSGTPYEIRPYITDLIGLRVVCLYEDELEKVAYAVKSQFEVIEVTDKVSAVEGTESAFGYKGLHLDLRLDAAHRALPSHALLAPFAFELQIRTIIQDSWSVLDHKIKYKKAIPGPLKRRINVLAALFELADREFRHIRDATEAELRLAPDETVAQDSPHATSTPPGGQDSAPGSGLNAFTFLKIATHFFKDFEFEPHKVDMFVDDIHTWSPDITRARFNSLLRQTIGIVKRYKQHHEEQHPSSQLNPYTVIRHCLYLGNKEVYARALRKASRDAFDAWLATAD
ncbi:(p)ppGpp synthetase [Rhodococcus sp. SRB_17]|uniref:GTP pyrophosphokinase n=1 Tax=Acidovorax sp. SRB_24 TaxID=1962700 RepID=UPI00145DBBFA|nr:(p)ppGpp synthetase [Acidovorax sp. SRB_24]NMM77038.1 (p)ppGpp synthetase [Acidovorax sp. SRB_24]NMM84730.1 (p)ppGpp synthetase [Rhodococcus sp. SRB_17]